MGHEQSEVAWHRAPDTFVAPLSARTPNRSDHLSPKYNRFIPAHCSNWNPFRISAIPNIGTKVMLCSCQLFCCSATLTSTPTLDRWFLDYPKPCPVEATNKFYVNASYPGVLCSRISMANFNRLHFLAIGSYPTYACPARFVPLQVLEHLRESSSVGMFGSLTKAMTAHFGHISVQVSVSPFVRVGAHQ